jgi:methylenetetrahydrofolate--tRNA-(uracil-5-)-methyltransferase
MSDDRLVSVIGGGLAGCECALALADRGVDVRLYEMRPEVSTPAHETGRLAELVCSNSLKATRQDSAAGLLKAELHLLGCHLLSLAEQAAVPAGGALAVDRDVFSGLVEQAVAASPRIELVREEVRELPAAGPVVVAAGPLCAGDLAALVEKRVGGRLAFYDAAAPIVDAASLDRGRVFAQSRYDRGEGADYLNCPMDKAAYDAFVDELVAAERVVSHDFERRELFQACQPVEEVARTGHDALRFGAFKPVGIEDPATGRRPWAVVQLRAENREGSAYNLVGFQTNLTWPEQRRVFRMIPGLEQAEFFRYGVMHRNTFIDAPRSLDATFALKDDRRVRFAGQITGTEGYTEAIATGLLAAMNVYADLTGTTLDPLPPTSALGSLVAYATSPDTLDYQPMHVNFGLVPPLETARRMAKRDRYQAYADRALADVRAWVAAMGERAGLGGADRVR